MADQARTPEPTGAPASVPGEHVVDERAEVVRVRRSPKYTVFLALGAALGLLTAMILTFAFHGTAQPSEEGYLYSPGQVFGFLALICVPVGIAVLGVVALILDRVVGKRARNALVDREHYRVD